MELGLFTCGYQYTNIESAFIDAAAFGYDFIELWGGRPHAWAPDMDAGRVAQLQELSARYAVPIRVYTPEHNGYPYNYMLGDEGQWEDCMRYLARSMEVSSRLGASRTLISVGHGGHTEPAQRRRGCCARCAGWHRRRGRPGRSSCWSRCRSSSPTPAPPRRSWQRYWQS